MEELPRNWTDFLRNLDATGMGGAPTGPSGGEGPPGIAFVVASTPAMEAMVFMYVVGLLEMLADNPRAKRRVLAHIAGMNGLTVGGADHRKK